MSQWTLALALTVTAGSAAWLVFAEAPAGEPAGASAPPLAPSDWKLSEFEVRGRIVYTKYCIGCHGESGRGDGAAARFLDPLPRNFQAGKFKFRSTPSGELPLESDLMRTVTCGLPGSSMPGFALVPEMQRRDVVRYVLSLAKLGLANRQVASIMAEEGTALADIKRDQLAAIQAKIEAAAAELRRVAVSPEPEATSASVDRGRVLFDAQCASCHGARGVGDGNSSHTLRDWENAVIRPRDFTTGVFRAGSTPEDVFIRIKTGLTGTPMPGYSNLPDSEVWDLTHFILSLKDPNAAKPRMQPGCGESGGDR